MPQRTHKTVITFVLLALAFPAMAQIPGVPASQTSPPAEPAADPLGRETPRGTVLGFNMAARGDDFASARQFMQIAPAQRSGADKLAMELNELIDRYFSQTIASLSAAGSGNVNDG